MMGDVPPEVERMGFHWGACLLSTYWAKEHGINGLATIQGAIMVAWVVSGFLARMGVSGAWIVRLACLVAVPALSYYFGRIGYREGWRYQRYPGGVKEYLEVERQWTRRAFIIAPACLAAIAGLIFFISWTIQASMPGGYFTRGGDDSDSTPTRSTISAPVRPANTPPAPPANTVVSPPSEAPTNNGAGGPQTPNYSSQPTGSYTTQAPAAAPSQPQPNSATSPPTSTAPAATPDNSGYGASSPSTAPVQDQPPVDNSATPSQQAPASQAPPQPAGTDTNSPPTPDANSAPPPTYQSGSPVDSNGAPTQ
jgi:hypothetical protein